METIRCGQCKHQKPIAEFAVYWRNGREQRRLSCIECLVCITFYIRAIYNNWSKI